MACFHPLTAWQLDGGEIVFAERGKVRRQLQLPCGRCIGCRVKRVRSWAIRCVHESKSHDVNSFVTLTYNKDHYDPGLDYRHIQLFLYRLRKSFGSGLRYFVAGEYGALNLRPHWHMLIFGFRPTDGIKCGVNSNGDLLFSSRVLSHLWDERGYVSFGDVSFQSAGYCAKYCVKRVTGSAAEAHYSRVNVDTGEVVQVRPEFARMSLKPGLGFAWFQRYWRDVYLARDGVCQEGGRVIPPPRYYDKLLDLLCETRGVGLEARMVGDDVLAEKQFQRYLMSREFAEDCSPERLLVRENIALARERLKRSVL